MLDAPSLGHTVKPSFSINFLLNLILYLKNTLSFLLMSYCENYGIKMVPHERGTE